MDDQGVRGLGTGVSGRRSAAALDLLPHSSSIPYPITGVRGQGSGVSSEKGDVSCNSFLSRHPLRARRAVIVLIGVTLLLRLGWAALLGANNDEAYNSLYTLHPALSYFDHPPLTMWVAKFGLLVWGGNVNLVSLRLGYLLMFAGSTWILYRLTARWYGEWAGFYAAAALNLSIYHTAAVGALALPDGPFLFFTLLTIQALAEALVGQPGRVRPWIWVGLAWSGALLTKYHAVLLPAGALAYMLVTPAARRLLRTPGPYLATLIGAVAFTPVVIWNAQHDWASFVFQGSRAVGWHMRPLGPLLMLGGAVLFLSPWILWSMARAVTGRLREAGLGDIDRLLMCLAGVPLVFFLVISLGRAVLAHWPLMGFVPLFCLVGHSWALWAESFPVRSRRCLAVLAVTIVSVAIMVLAQSRYGLVSFAHRDPCWEFSGWESVGSELRKRGLVGQPDTFLFTGCWDDSGQVAFAIGNQSPVLCYNPSGDSRGFAFWSRPEEWVGKDAYFVSMDDHVWEYLQYQPYFESIEPVAEFSMTRGGKPFRDVRVYRCTHQVKPFPFTCSRSPVVDR